MAAKPIAKPEKPKKARKNRRRNRWEPPNQAQAPNLDDIPEESGSEQESSEEESRESESDAESEAINRGSDTDQIPGIEEELMSDTDEPPSNVRNDKTGTPRGANTRRSHKP